LGESESGIPLLAEIKAAIPLPAIPIYLSEKLTGLIIDSEDKNIAIQTKTETLVNGDEPQTNQKALGSNIRINIVADRDSIGVTLLSALADLILPKVTSKEYSITYLHGAITVFGGLLETFSIAQNSDNTLCNITIEIARAAAEKTKAKEKLPSVTSTRAGVPG